MNRSIIILIAYILTTIGLGIFLHGLFFIMFILPVILNFIDLIGGGYNSTNYMFGVFRKKKRVYTQYGRFYIMVREGHLYLYQDKLFYLKFIDYTNYHGVESSKGWIKARYDSIYHQKLAKDNLQNELKKWNGYIDLQTERDKKLDKIL